MVKILKNWNFTTEGVYEYMKSCQHQAMYTMFMVLIELGNYASIIEDFNQVFDKHVYLVDGDLIVHNPNEEFSS